MGWSDEYSVGNERIDNQHKMIFKMADDFKAALDDNRGDGVYSELLKSLSSYTQAHFRVEEKAMEACKCPVAVQNKEEHMKLIDVLSGFQQRYLERGFDREDAYNLVNTIDRWLADHICSIDMHLKDLNILP